MLLLLAVLAAAVLGTVGGVVLGLAVLAGESEILVDDELAGDGVAGSEKSEGDDDTCRDFPPC